MQELGPLGLGGWMALLPAREFSIIQAATPFWYYLTAWLLDGSAGLRSKMLGALDAVYSDTGSIADISVKSVQTSTKLFVLWWHTFWAAEGAYLLQRWWLGTLWEQSEHCMRRAHRHPVYWRKATGGTTVIIPGLKDVPFHLAAIPQPDEYAFNWLCLKATAKVCRSSILPKDKGWGLMVVSWHSQFPL